MNHDFFKMSFNVYDGKMVKNTLAVVLRLFLLCATFSVGK